MSIFQKAYDWVKGLKTPSWLKAILGELQVIFFDLLFQIGKEYVEAIKGKIIEVDANNDLSNEDKFDKVFDFIKIELNLAHLKDSSVNLLVETLVSFLKKKGII